MSTPPLFPLFFKLEGRDCLVVGGTSILESKIAGLLESGARVRLIAHNVADAIRELVDREPLLWLRRDFQTSDLQGIALVLASDPDPLINTMVSREAAARNIPCNIVDQPYLCSFYYPAVVRRGQLQIAISTGGLSPSLASRLRKELEQRIGPDYGAWVSALGRARERILRTRTASPRRNELLRRITSRHAFETLRLQQRAKKGAA